MPPSDGVAWVYVGEFVNGTVFFSGSGVITWADGAIKEGIFVDGLLEGYGTWRYQSVSDDEWYTYKGYFAIGEFHRQGKIIGDKL